MKNLLLITLLTTLISGNLYAQSSFDLGDTYSRADVELSEEAVKVTIQAGHDAAKINNVPVPLIRAGDFASFTTKIEVTFDRSNCNVIMDPKPLVHCHSDRDEKTKITVTNGNGKVLLSGDFDEKVTLEISKELKTSVTPVRWGRNDIETLEIAKISLFGNSWKVIPGDYTRVSVNESMIIQHLN